MGYEWDIPSGILWFTMVYYGLLWFTMRWSWDHIGLLIIDTRYPLGMTNSWLWKMAWLCLTLPLKIVIFHSYVKVYQSVTRIGHGKIMKKISSHGLLGFYKKRGMTRMGISWKYHRQIRIPVGHIMHWIDFIFPYISMKFPLITYFNCAW